MIDQPVLDPPFSPQRPDAARFKVGTLSYTKAGLITVFLYLLWGDFCFTLMETVVPSILPLKLNSIGASNWTIGLIMTTIPNLMNAFINPFISFRSDRFRSRWGRRIPFLAAVTPFLVVFLILLGYSEPIGRWAHHVLLGGKGSDTFVILLSIGLFMVCFQFFNLFVTSVYYYLFNDVVPHAFLARFMALFRVVGTGAGALYQYFVFKYANTHMAEIFLAAALLYFVAFVMMCWKVKEGSYPPPPENLGQRPGFVGALRTYARECFTHRFYWFFFLSNCAMAMTWASAPYGVLVSTKVAGLDFATLGTIHGIAAVVSLILLYPAGMLADKFHPLRIYLASSVAHLVLTPLSIVFYFNCHRMESSTVLLIFIALSAINLPLGVLHNAAELPMYMKLLPQERYGQFSSANALLRSVVLVVGGSMCGPLLDFVKRFNPASDFCFRFVPVWNFLFYALSVFFLVLLYREWRRLGGEASYQPPRPDLPDSQVVYS